MTALDMKTTEDAFELAREMDAQERVHLWNHYTMIRDGLRWQLERLKKNAELMELTARLQLADGLQKVTFRAQLMREACEEFDRIKQGEMTNV